MSAQGESLASHLQEQPISRVLASQRLHHPGDKLAPACLRKRAFPHVSSSAGTEKMKRRRGAA